MGTVRNSIEVILFDLGGVLIELTGVPTFLGWIDRPMSADEMWRHWLTSPAVRRFEVGEATAEEFGTAVVHEFGLSVGAEEFVAAFTRWPRGPFPGAIPLLASLHDSYHLACLSNTNTLHWNRIRDEMGLGRYFRSSFLSHLIGRLKPDREVFDFVLASLGCAPQRILFLDDNQVNVDGALSVGMQARRTSGILEVTRALEELGIVPR